MMTFLIIMHVTACTILIILVLIQRGRGAGLVESFAGVESMFGTKTSAFLTRTTTIMSIVFFITCLSLAFLSVKQSKSLMENRRKIRLLDKPLDLPKVEVTPNVAVVPSAAVVTTPAAAPAVTVDQSKEEPVKAEK